jgi:hypothetical protein
MEAGWPECPYYREKPIFLIIFPIFFPIFDFPIFLKIYTFLVIVIDINIKMLKNTQPSSSSSIFDLEVELEAV